VEKTAFFVPPAVPSVTTYSCMEEYSTMSPIVAQNVATVKWKKTGGQEDKKLEG